METEIKYRNLKQLLLVCALVTPAALFLSCSIDLSDSGGTTTETTNGITAVILTHNGEIAQNIPVQVRPQSYLYDPDTLLDTNTCKDTNTDEFGRFTVHCQVSKNETFLIKVLNQDSTEGIVEFIDLVKTNVENDTVINDLQVLTMQETGSYAGELSSPNTMILKFYGMDLFDTLKPNELFEISGLPPKEYVIQISYTPSSEVIVDTIEIHPNTITLAAGSLFTNPFEFKGFKKISFNTSSDGADIIDDITDFPLLIRLNSSIKEDSLIFAHTKVPGSIRFLDEQGDTIDYQIENWDTASFPKTAAIWIKIPVIFGNNKTQYIRLAYGAALPDIQNPEEVFDWKQGYASIWHLNEANGTIVYDATSNHYNGSKVSEWDPLSYEGYIANGQAFDGVNDWIDMGRDIGYINNVQKVTLSAWIYLMSFDCNIIRISGGNEQYDRAFVYVDSSGYVVAGGNAVDTPADPDKKITATLPLESNQWYHLCCIINYMENQVDIYINGEKTTTTGTVQFENHQTLNTNSKFTSLGSNITGTDGFSNCIIDEFRIWRGGRYPSWIKLCYQTQRKDSPFFK